METGARIDNIQSGAAAEKTRISALDSKISNAALKKQLQQATFWLNDVEGFLIPHAMKTPPALSPMWVDHAELMLHLAVQRREFIQKIIDTYGPDAVSVNF